jgi:hypothetical protein
MPELGDRGKIKVVLETASKISNEEVWVEISQIVLAEDIDEMGMDSASALDRTRKTYEFLAKAILDWNLMLKGEKAAITAENLRKLPLDDLMDLNNKFEYDRQLSRVKKNSSSSTLPIKENPELTPPSTSSS